MMSSDSCGRRFALIPWLMLLNSACRRRAPCNPRHFSTATSVFFAAIEAAYDLLCGIRVMVHNAEVAHAMLHAVGMLCDSVTQLQLQVNVKEAELGS